MPPFPHLKMETDPVSETLFFSNLQFWTMEKVHKPSNPECYAPSSEPFRFYLKTPSINSSLNISKSFIWKSRCKFQLGKPRFRISNGTPAIPTEGLVTFPSPSLIRPRTFSFRPFPFHYMPVTRMYDVICWSNACYYSVEKLLSPRLLPKNIRIRIYRSIIWSVDLYGCET
jgi:hypothetical protein